MTVKWSRTRCVGGNTDTNKNGSFNEVTGVSGAAGSQQSSADKF